MTSAATLLKISHTLAKRFFAHSGKEAKFSMWPQKIVIRDEILKQKIFNHRSRIITDLTNMIATVDMAYTQYGKGNLHHSVEFKSCKTLLELLKETEHTAAIHWRIVAHPDDFDKLYEDEASSMQVNLTSADLKMLRTQSVRNAEWDSLADELSVETPTKKARHCKKAAKVESPEIAPPKIDKLSSKLSLPKSSLPNQPQRPGPSFAILRGPSRARSGCNPSKQHFRSLQINFHALPGSFFR